MPGTDLTTPGMSLDSLPGWRTGTIDPSDLSGASGTPWWLSALNNMNPFARGAIAAGGVMQPTPADTGELPSYRSGVRPQHPPSTGAMPQAGAPTQLPGATPASPQGTIVPPATAPLPSLPDWGSPWSGAPQSAAAAAPAVTTNAPNLPYGPAAAAPAVTTNAPSRPVTPTPVARAPGPIARAKMARKVATAAPSPMFVPITAPNADPLNRNQANPYRPQMSALNLSGLFGR